MSKFSRTAHQKPAPEAKGATPSTPATPANPAAAAVTGAATPAKAAPNAIPEPPARPEAATAEGKKGKGEGKKNKRTKFAVPEGGLESFPAEFDPKKHKPLRRVDFKDETVWLEKKAAQYESAAKKLRDEAAEIKASGGTKSHAKAKKLMKVQGEMDALAQALKDQGVDVEGILAKHRAAAAEKEAAAATPAAPATPTA